MRVFLVERAMLLGIAMVLLLAGCHHVSVRAPNDDSQVLPTVTAEELFQVALFQARRGDLLRAEQYLVAARDHGYDDVATTYWLIRVCVLSGRYHSGLRHAARHLQQHPSDWRLRLIVASIYEALGEPVRAQSELENVVRREPSQALPRFRLGMLYRDTPDLTRRANQHLEAYLRLDPEGAHAEEARETLGSNSSTDDHSTTDGPETPQEDGP
jgi:predicted Zn-dependent protease